MKILTTIFVAASIALMAIAGAVVVQHHGEHPVGHGNSTPHKISISSKELGLSAEQSAKIKAIQERAARKSQEIEKDSSLNAQAKAEANAKVHKQAMDEVKKVLTPTQFRELLLVQHTAQMHEHLKLMADKLELSSAQQAEIKKIVDDAVVAFRAINNNDQLTEEEKDAQAGELHSATMEKIHGVFTPEQRQKASDMHGGGFLH